MSDKKYNQIIETAVGIFTVEKGKIKILLVHKKNDPYKGYWILPTRKFLEDESLDSSVEEILNNNIGISNLYKEQCYTFSNIDSIEGKITIVSYIGLINNITLKLKQEINKDIELEWFDIKSIPKLGYEHEIMIDKMISYLKSRIVNSNILKILFPSDFTLPELQKVYEQILETKLDRRNFRKKLINLDYIEDTGDMNEGYTGRPAKLYRFKEQIKEKNLF